MAPDRRWLGVMAAAYGFAAVLLAALGAHAIPFHDEAAMRLWDTALLLHFFHAAALLGVAALAVRHTGALMPWSGSMMGAGTLLFSGSLYFRSAGIDALPTFVAPAGGFVLLFAWLTLAIALLKSKS